MCGGASSRRLRRGRVEGTGTGEAGGPGASSFCASGAGQMTPWILSVGLLLGGQAADTATTLRAQGKESNPLGQRGALIVGWTSTGGLLGAEFALRHHPRVRKALSFVNLSVGGIHLTAAGANARH